MSGSDVQNITQVVFIDSRAPDIQELIVGAAPGQLVFVLDPSTDGVQQIASILENNHLTGLAAISIVGHGASGQIQLGSTWLDEGDLAGHAAALSAIGASLTTDGDLLLYACATAAGTAGQKFIADLATYTGADVAAATHLVGSADGGGSWTLDASTGAIEAQTPFSATALANFQGELAGPLNGQLFIATNGNGATNHDPGNGALVAADNRVMVVNNDGSGATTVFHDTLSGGGTPLPTPIAAQRDLVLDPASGLYFTLAQDTSLTGNIRAAVLVGKLDGSAPAFFHQNPDTSSIANIASISIDASTHTLYVSQYADYNNGIQANNGIFSFTYDPVTGALSNKQQVVSLFPLTPGAETGQMAAHVVNGKLYFEEVTYTIDTGDVRIWSYDVNTHALTALTPSGTFTLHYTTTPPITTTGQALGNLAVNSTTNKIYFLEGPAGGGAQHLFEVSTSGGTPVEITVPGGLDNSITDLAIDSANNTLYISNGGAQQIQMFSIGADGTTLTAAGTIPLGLQPPPGAGNPDNDFGIGDSPYDRPAGLDFVDLPTLTVSGTTAKAVQGGGPVSLLTSTPTITDPTGGYLTDATVTISNFQAGDVLAATVTGAITASYSNGVLTLSGTDTIANYKQVLASVTYTDTGSDSSTGGHPTRSIVWHVDSGEVGDPSGTNTTTTTLTIDRAIVTVADNGAVVEGASTTSSSSVLSNDSDKDGDTVTLIGFKGSTGGTSGPAGTLGVSYAGTYGHLTLSSNGNYTYTADITAAIDAAPTGSHPVETFLYTVSDGTVTTTTQLAITIDRAPDAVADTGAAAIGTPATGNVLTNDGDSDGDSLTVSAVTGGTVGTLFHGTYGDITLNTNGSYTYTVGVTGGQQTSLANAPAGHPTEVITYTVSDGHGGTTNSTLTITLDRAPVGVADVNSATSGGAPATGNVVSNDTDKDNDTLTVSAVAGGAVGTLFHGSYGDITLLANGNYTYAAGATQTERDVLAGAGGSATEVITYTASDGHGGTTTSTLSIDVLGAPSITSVTATAPGGLTDLNAGKVVTITVNFSIAVFIAGGTPTLQLSNGELATFVSGGATTTLVFSYTVQPGHDTSDLLVQSLLTNGATIKDGTGQDAILTNAATDLHLQIDTIAPAAPTLFLNQDTGIGGDNITSNSAILYIKSDPVDTLLYKADGAAVFSSTVPVFTTDGSHTVLVQEVDAAGNISSASSLTFTLDTTAPVAPTVLLHQDTGVAGDNITSNPLIDYTKSDPLDTLLFKADGAVVFSSAVPVFTTDGVHTVSVEEIDAAGNSSVSNLTFTLDTTAPVAPGVSLHQDTGAPGDNITSNPAIDYAKSDSADTLLYKADDATVFSSTAPVFTTDGVHTVSVEEVDAAGNVSSVSSLTFTLDTTAPTAPTLALHQDTGTGGDNLTANPLIDYTKSDSADTLLYKADGAAVFSSTVPVFTTDGSHTVSVEEVDAAGNISSTSSLTFTLDTTGPTLVSLTANPNPVNAGQTSTVTFTFSEVVAGFSLGDISWAGGTLGNLQYDGLNGSGQDVYEATFTPDVANTLAGTVQVNGGSYTDLAGNTGAASSLIHINGDTQPPGAPSLALHDDTGVSGDHITSNSLIDYTKSDPADTLLYKADGAASFTAGVPVFTTDGVHTVSVEEVDAAGNVSQTSSLSFTLDTTGPTVAIGADHTVLHAGDAALMTFTFSEAVAGFSFADTTVSGGALSNLVHAGVNGLGQDIYTATFTPVASDTEVGSVHVNASGYTDIAGNGGAASNSVGFTGDTKAPGAPTLALHSDTGVSATDHITNSALIDYTKFDPTDTLLYKADGASSFSAAVPVFSGDGTHSVSIEERDAAGNLSVISSLSFTLDTSAPQFAGLTASPGSGVVAAGSTLQLTVDFNEAVYVSGGTPTLTLNDGGSAVYDAAATALLGDASKLVFDHLVSPTDHASAFAVTGFAVNGAGVTDLAGNAANVSGVSAVFDALQINETTAAAYTIGGITRPELHFDSGGHILLDAAASAFAGQYGIEYLYLGLPPGTPYPPVADLNV